MNVDEEAVDVSSRLQRGTHEILTSSGDRIGGENCLMFIPQCKLSLQMRVIRMKKVIMELRPNQLVKSIFKHLHVILYTFHM